MYQGHNIEPATPAVSPISSHRSALRPAREWEYSQAIAQAHALRARIVREMLANLWRRLRGTAAGKTRHDTPRPGTAFDNR